MRTSERTYKQFLAFDDPDRKSDLHDAACLYLAQDEKLRKLFVLVNPAWVEKSFQDWDWYVTESKWSHQDSALKMQRYTYLRDTVRISKASGSLSSAVVEDVAYYRGGKRNVVGYLDLLVTLEVSADRIVETKSREALSWSLKRDQEFTDWSEPEQRKEVSSLDISFVVEVKAGRTSISNVIQQLNLYKAYAHSGGTTVWVLATLYPLSQAEKDMLAEEKIAHIYVSEEQVRAFLAAQRKVEDLPF